MTTSGKIILALVSLVVTGVFLSCNNDTGNTTGETLKTDTMNTTTLEKKSGHDTSIRNSEGYLHINDGGEGGLPVLFIHSFGGSNKQWENQLEHLRSNRRAIAMDLRGHAGSYIPVDNNYEIESLVNDIATIVDSLALTRFVLVGHSMGGSMAIAYAGLHPERVAGLLITGTPGKTPATQSKPIIASLESDKYDQVMEDYMKKLLTNAKPETDSLERDGMDKISRKAIISIIKAVFNYDPLPALRNYPGPKMIVSPAGEEQPNSLHTAFPNIPYKSVAGTSHWIQMDKPKEFNQILDEFLATVKENK